MVGETVHSVLEVIYYYLVLAVQRAADMPVLLLSAHLHLPPYIQYKP